MQAVLRQSVAPVPQDIPIHPILGVIPERVRIAVMDRAQTRRFQRGAPLFWQGDRLPWLPLVQKGHVKLIRNTRSGREVVADLAGPGDTLCWSQVLADEPVPLSAIALEEATILLLPTTPIRHCVSTDPRVAFSWVQSVEERFESLLDQVAETRAPSVPARLGGLLLHLLDRRGDPRTGHIPVKMTRQDLADSAGTTVETVIRLMRRWEKAGLVETQRDGFLVRDAAGLRDASDGLDG